MGKRDIGKEIIQGLQEVKSWKRGEMKLRTTTVELPRASDVSAIRRRLGLSQAQFAAFVGVSVATLRNWEQKRREPHGPARALLLIAARQPHAVREAFKASAPSPKARALAMTVTRASRIAASKRKRRSPSRRVAERPSLEELRSRLDQRSAVRPSVAPARAVRAERDRR